MMMMMMKDGPTMTLTAWLNCEIGLYCISISCYWIVADHIGPTAFSHAKKVHFLKKQTRVELTNVAVVRPHHKPTNWCVLL